MLCGRGSIVTELGPLETLTPARILDALVTEAERLVEQLRSGALVLHPGDSVDLVVRLRVQTAAPPDEPDPAA